MPDWHPAFVLPDLPLRQPIEGEIAAMVAPDDPRILDISKDHPALTDFLGRFTDCFGNAVAPSVVIARDDATDALFKDIGPLGAFRDLIAMSYIPRSWAGAISNERSVVWGDHFAIHPWMITDDFQRILGRTPAVWHLHKIEEFGGQSSPRISPRSALEASIDPIIFDALLARWKKFSLSSAPLAEDVALFRSLHMARYAAQVPGSSDTHFFDLGRALSLWVSAFEILLHPGPGKKVKLATVLRSLDRAPWRSSLNKARSYPTEIRNSDGTHKTTPAVMRCIGSAVYEQIYLSRCKFLHGEVVEPADLNLPTSGRQSFLFAAPLYRMALAQKLGIKMTKRPVDEFATFLLENDFDEAIALAFTPPPVES